VQIDDDFNSGAIGMSYDDNGNLTAEHDCDPDTRRATPDSSGGPPAAWPLRLLYIAVLLVGIHSVVLGGWIYVSPNGFCQLLLGADPADLFFVRQAGLFLVCLGLFYVSPLLDFRRLHGLVVLIIVTKALAVVFLASNAGHSPSPHMIHLTALGDGGMGLALLVCYVVFRRRHRA
jgi:hypothetical protein